MIPQANMSPTITVLMAVYNGEEFLREAVESILDQTFSDFEFVIINDASTDETEQILHSYMDARIRVLRNDSNLGLTKSLNRGLSLAKGKFIARMDADDISHPERLGEQCRFLEANPDVGIVGSWTEVIDENGITTDFWKWPCSPEEIYYVLNFKNCLTHSSVMFRKDIVAQHGGYNETIERAQDYELWQRISKATKICQFEKPLVKWRKVSTAFDASKWERQNYTVDITVRNNMEVLCNERIENGSYLFIKEFFEKRNLKGLTRFDHKGLFRSIALIAKINERIIEISPQILDKQVLRRIADGRLIHYFFVASPRMNFREIASCLSILKNHEGYFKVIFVLRILYRKIRFIKQM